MQRHRRYALDLCCQFFETLDDCGFAGDPLYEQRSLPARKCSPSNDARRDNMPEPKDKDQTSDPAVIAMLTEEMVAACRKAYGPVAQVSGTRRQS